MHYFDQNNVAIELYS